ncbi:MAG: hypothetical protein Q8Q37_02915 [bacterium]|nr:hypothetical protein [bacterium]
MANIIEGKEKSSGLGKLIGLIVLIVIIGAIVYYLFFAPTPAFDIIVPPPLQSAERIYNSEIDSTTVLNSQAFRNLTNYVPVQTVGVIGRANPFQPF